MTTLGIPAHAMHSGVNPFTGRGLDFWSSLISALLATTVFQCWHILLFFTVWGVMVTLISRFVYTLKNLHLGWVPFERYNEGRRYWSTIILGSRTFARIVWFHVPDVVPGVPGGAASTEELKARALIEKKTIFNLIEAFSVATKHYLRGEEGIHHEDLYHLVKFLPPYAFPAGLPSAIDLSETPKNLSSDGTRHSISRNEPKERVKDQFPLPVTVEPRSPVSGSSTGRLGGESSLLPANNPPKFAIFDVFPFSLLIRRLTNRGKVVKGKKAARLRATMGMEGTLLLTTPPSRSRYTCSYISALQAREDIDSGTITALLNALLSFTDSLAGLERILTTPIQFSYSSHLWMVTAIYCLALPFQIWKTMGWITIPGTTVVAFFFFGLLVAGEEIENPFGYNKNDLNLDHFTHVIIRNELRAIAAIPVPDPAVWAFSDVNDCIFTPSSFKLGDNGNRASPQEWVRRGSGSMQRALLDV